MAYSRGEKHGKAKLTREKVIEIRKTYMAYVRTYSELARFYNVSDSTIRDVVEHRTWRWL